MKQILVILSLFFCLSANAQIQRTFFGLEFGVATKQDVKRMLTSKSLEIDESESDIIITSNMTFGGEKWRNVAFKFYKGKFFSIRLLMESTPINNSSVKESIARIVSILKEKYPDYMKDYKGEFPSFFDMRTLLSIEHKTTHYNINIYVLDYSDFLTMWEIDESRKDEF